MSNPRNPYNIGQSFGGCVLVEFAGVNKHQVRLGIFECKCGNKFKAIIGRVKNGHTKSCGCLQKIIASRHKIKYNDGDKMGNLIFLKRVESPPLEPRALFLCRCGKEFITRIQSAKDKTTKSCGCVSRELTIMGQTKHPPVEYIVPNIKKIPTLDQSHQERFWNKVAITANPNKCWNWLGTGDRYGAFTIGKGIYKSNRVAYSLFYKQDPGEFEVMHSCDNGKCCNPHHLSLGTHYDNMRDMVKKGRSNKQYK